MAKRPNWDKARDHRRGQRELVTGEQHTRDEPPPMRRSKPPTEKQLAYLKRLSKQAGRKTPRPRTVAEASRTIRDMKRLVDEGNETPPPRPGTGRPNPDPTIALANGRAVHDQIEGLVAKHKARFEREARRSAD